DGALGRAGVDLSAVEPAIDRIEALLAAARSAGATVAFARVVTRDDADSVAIRLLNERRGRSPGAIAICREGTPGAADYRIAPASGDVVAEKRLYDAFHGTGLEADLRRRGVDTLVLAGLTTHCCVDATARAAFHRDFNVFVVSDATAAYDHDLHEGALKTLSEICALVTRTEDVASAWGAC
ncbi:MAG TPA: cysteine hydrolase, partial [Caulobacteraceae bacterium]|nr:cysteine hydrolase [Caulobacteraceae bacterium]